MSFVSASRGAGHTREPPAGVAAGHPRFLPGKVEVHIADLGASCVELFVQVDFRVTT